MEHEYLPKLYIDRENYSPEDHYIFISYSHKDKDIVYNDLNKLYDLGVKYWYDRGLEAGTDAWYAQVEKRIRDSRCVAVVFFLSPHVFTSNAIEKEIEFLKYKDEIKPYFTINIGGGNTTALQDEASLLPDEEKRNRSSKRTQLICSMFDDDLPFIARSLNPEDDSHIEKVYANLKKYNITDEFDNINKELLGYSKLNYVRNSANVRTVEFGTYPQSEVKMFSIWKKDLVEHEENVFYRHDEKYLLANGKYFRFEPIKWRILNYENNKLTLLSEKCIDYQEYHSTFEPVYWENSQIHDWLNNAFYNTAFTDKEKLLLTKIDDGYVSLPTLEELTNPNNGFENSSGVTPSRESSPTDYALELGAYSGPTGTCYWWYKMPFGNGSISSFVYDNGGLSNYAGATRAMICIDLTKYNNLEN